MEKKRRRKEADGGDWRGTEIGGDSRHCACKQRNRLGRGEMDLCFCFLGARKESVICIPRAGLSGGPNESTISSYSWRAQLGGFGPYKKRPMFLLVAQLPNE